MPTIQNTTNLSVATIAHQLSAGTKPEQELRSKGTDLYVKKSTAFFTKEQSRTDHRNNALALVKTAVQSDLGLTPLQTGAFLQKVVGTPIAPTQITAGNLQHLASAVDIAGRIGAHHGEPAHERAIAAELLVRGGLPEATATDIVNRLGSQTTRDIFTALTRGDMAALGTHVNGLPNDQHTVDSLLAIEAALVAKADTNDISRPAITPPCHQILYTKRTEALETVIQGKLGASADVRLTATLGRLPQGEYWRLLMDGRHQTDNNKHFFDRSKGYMGSMMAGLNHIVDPVGAPLTPDYLQRLHTVSTTSVTKEMRTDDGIPLGKNMFQLAGVVKQAPNVWGVCSSFTPDGMNELRAIRQDLQAHLPLGAPEFFSDATAQADSSRADVQAWRAGNPLDPDLPGTVRALVQYATDRGNLEIAAATTEDGKLGAIIDTCRRLGSIHPFEDANGRLMMFLVLNKLLVDNGLSPTILQDQGFMIGKSRDELIALIKTGQGNVTAMLH